VECTAAETETQRSLSERMRSRQVEKWLEKQVLDNNRRQGKMSASLNSADCWFSRLKPSCFNPVL
ncbi:hypothetical protein, partial [Endozoicomonas sp. ALB060]|uniref:hypothetical protein n=1 Tax=Endozoicomonas sp. ALB060 TaxID=3403072 RepID=UPI003BB7BE53